MSEALTALLNYRQADEDGIMVLTSRQAIHEVAARIEQLEKALREIADFDTDEDISNEECMRDIARAALEGKS